MENKTLIRYMWPTDSVIISSQKGFSIASVVVAMGIFSVLALGIASVVQHLMGQIVYLEDKQSAVSLKTELTIDLSENQSCVNTLTGITVDRTPGSVVTIARIKDKTGKTLYSSGAYDRLRIVNLSLENAAIGATDTSGKMHLIATLETEKGKMLSPVRIPLGVTLDATNRVDSCSSNGNGKMCALYFARGARNAKPFIVPPAYASVKNDVPEGFSFKTSRLVCNSPFGCSGSERDSPDPVYTLHYCKNGEWNSIDGVDDI